MADQTFPLQPIVDGRFVENRIVNWLISQVPNSLNTIPTMAFTDEEQMQLAQLGGYSLSGYGSLHYVSEESYATAEAMSDGSSTNELEARNEVLREKLADVEEHVKNAAVALFRAHPDDFAR